MRPTLALPAALLAACVPADEAPDRPGPDDSDTPVVEDTDSDPVVDTDPGETDTGDTTVEDTGPPVAPAALPASWGPGFVELAEPIWTARPFTIVPSSFVDLRVGQNTAAWFGDLDG